MTDTGKHGLWAAAEPPRMADTTARGAWGGRRRPGLAAAPLAAVAVAGLLVGGTSARAAQAHPAPGSAGRGYTAYVSGTGPGGNYVTPINTRTNRPGKPIKAGDVAYNVAVTPDGKTLYVADQNGNTVTPIATATNTPGKPIKAGKGPFVIAITPDGKTAYVVDQAHVGAPGTVTPIRTVTNAPGKPIKVGGFPVDIAFAPRPTDLSRPTARHAPGSGLIVRFDRTIGPS